MTQGYELLQDSPQTGIDISDLNYEEREEVRRIKVRGTYALNQTNKPGRFTDVFYLEGDEEAAAEVFVEENGELLDEVDFSERNVLQTSMQREIYDLILDTFGCRSITKYDTVVCEERPDGTQWIIDRSRYDTEIDRRYTISETGSSQVPPDVQLKEIYENFDDTITESDLRETELKGDVRQVLDYFRVSSEFACLPFTTDDEQMALHKY